MEYSRKDRARQVLSDGNSCAISLSVAADILTDGAHAIWEFEALWMFLEDLECLPDSDSRDRLMAATSIRMNPSHLWGGFVFANLVATLNGRECTPEIVEQVSLGELTWGVIEAEKILSHYGGESTPSLYGDEPSVYAAAVCANNGLSIVPPELSFCEEALESMPRSGREEEIRAKTLSILSSDSKDVDETDAASLQAQKLREVAEYVRVFRRKLELELDTLRA